MIDEQPERGVENLPETIEAAIDVPQNRDKDEEDPDGRMTDLLPAPEDDFEDEAVATETEDDYSDESDAEVETEETGVDNPVETELEVNVTSNTDGDLASHFGNGSSHRKD
ncbi:MAG: hypothetical protein QM758_09060 [Armatimonas sp.]